MVDIRAVTPMSIQVQKICGLLRLCLMSAYHSHYLLQRDSQQQFPACIALCSLTAQAMLNSAFPMGVSNTSPYYSAHHASHQVCRAATALHEQTSMEVQVFSVASGKRSSQHGDYCSNEICTLGCHQHLGSTTKQENKCQRLLAVQQFSKSLCRWVESVLSKF